MRCVFSKIKIVKDCSKKSAKIPQNNQLNEFKKSFGEGLNYIRYILNIVKKKDGFNLIFNLKILKVDFKKKK